MNTRFWIIVFLAILAFDLFAVYSGYENLRSISKPLLMPVLIADFIFSTKAFVSSLKKWVVLALVFSWLGDVLLMFDLMNNNFFIFGLIAFLIAHIFYIVFYERITRLENLRKNYWLFIPVLIYYSILIYVLSPHLGEMKLPVRIYGVVISYMLIQALQVARIKNKQASGMMIIGAILFIASDSILAINKFYSPFETAGIAIMATYGIAQLLITLGAISYIKSSTHKFAA